MKLKRTLGAVAVLAAATLVGLVALTPRASAEATLFGDRRPEVSADLDRDSVELGVRFSADVTGAVTGIRFYKNAENIGRHPGTLWSEDGVRLATTVFRGEDASGWQEAEFDEPVLITPGQTYTASYVAPSGRYAADTGGFAQPYHRGHLTVPAGGGVYRYGSGGFPESTWQSSNYYVDVLFRADSPTSPPPSPTPSSTRPGSPGPAGSPTAQPSGNPPAADVLDLPRVPWEGQHYWKQFAKADRAGWDDPDFFPVAVWWSVASSKEEVEFDRSLGLNTYVLTDPQADYRLIEDGGMYWVGGELPHSTAASRNWVGTFLDDEVDGRFEPTEGYKILQSLSDRSKPSSTGRFRYANYTSGIVSYDRPPSVSNQYVNAYTDVVSLDQYFYGVPQCDWPADTLRWRTPATATAITPDNCRSSSSYGKTVDLLRESDAADARLQAIWQFVEVVGDSSKLDGSKVQGQVMASIIHGARGIVWFPQSFSGGCETGNAFRTYEFRRSSCLTAQVEGARKVNLLIRALAPVLNTQSYAWDFGPGIDAMLKVKDGSAYVFAMTDDVGTGKRTFTLPPGVRGTSVDVVGENRKLPVTKGAFEDSFAVESSYHVYRVRLS